MGLADIASEYTSAVSGLVTVLEAHPDLSYPADVGTEPVEPAERICEKFHARSERLIGEHKNLLSLTRQTNRRPRPRRRRCFPGRCESFEKRRHRTWGRCETA